MQRLIHLVVPPRVGRSMLAQRYGLEHPGTLVGDIDLLRTWVAGWQVDAAVAGAGTRTADLAMITAYLAEGGEVIAVPGPGPDTTYAALLLALEDD